MIYIDKKNTYIDKEVKIGEETIIYPNVFIKGNSIIGKNNIIYPGCFIVDTIIGDNNIIYNSQIVSSEISNNNSIGPYANIRENNLIKDNIKIGSFVELKNANIENNSKIPHLSYLGDTDVGENVNIGCGVITANYDGKNKHKTVIENNAFIGCNANLIAPLKIGVKSIIGAGSTITNDVPDNALAIARERQTTKENYNE